MSSPIQGLRTCIYSVADKLPQATAWYERVLGFAPYFTEPFYVGFNVGGFELGLMPESPGPSPAEASGVIVYWGVENCASAYQRLLALGGSEHVAPADVGGGIMVATVRDPFGNVFGVIENPHFKLPG